MIEALAAGVAIGVLLGTVSGLVPGIHANTMAGLLLGVQGTLLAVLGETTVALAMFTALITHTFLDIIPSTFLGVPDPDTALSVLPAHALCLEGSGIEAVRISALGSACAVVVAMPLFLLFILVLPALQPFIDWGIGLLLIAVAGYLTIDSDSPGWYLVIFLVSGALGVFTLHHTYLAWHTLGMTSLLMPLLSGLFGVSVLLKASQGVMPPQTFEGIRMEGRNVVRQSVLGSVAGAVVGWLPGLSNATANALLSAGIRYNVDRREYILATSAANTSNAFLGLAALVALSRSRNGVMVALATRDLPPVGILLSAGVAAAILAYLLTIHLSGISRWFGNVRVRTVSAAVIIVIAVLCLVLTGPFGLFILVLATLVGLTPPLVNIRRVACMGSIMLPIILFSFGVAI